MRKSDEIDQAIQSNLARFREARALTVRPGYRFQDKRITRQRAIVVLAGPDTVLSAIPDSVGGYPTDVRKASAAEILRAKDPAAYADAAARVPAHLRPAFFPLERDVLTGKAVPAPLPAAKPTVPYTPPTGVTLDPVTDQMSITCSVSPDAGWIVLSGFLAAVTQELTVAMYDFTSAHVLSAVKAALSGAGRTLSLVLDDPPLNPTADQSDAQTEQALSQELGARLAFAWAAEALDPNVASAIFPNAYHIKVAVRDQEAFWLSSGNWNNSNQPDIDPWTDPTGAAAVAAKSDRDWHVVVEHPGLSQTFEAYLRHDLEVAKALQAPGAAARAALPAALLAPDQAPRAVPRQFFKPLSIVNQAMSIQPVLTPDLGVGNYAANLLELIGSAKEKLYIQTQYVHPPQAGEDPGFAALIAAVEKKMQAGLDVRVILSEYETAPYLEQLQEAGWNMSAVRIQTGVHNKAFVVDSSVVAVGSQNWSGDGVLRNRDATLIIEHVGAAQYFESVFLYDWAQLAVAAA
jgi:hypothetical protein